jgi:hypothetical protein
VSVLFLFFPLPLRRPNSHMLQVPVLQPPDGDRIDHLCWSDQSATFVHLQQPDQHNSWRRIRGPDEPAEPVSLSSVFSIQLHHLSHATGLPRALYNNQITAFADRTFDSLTSLQQL